MKSFKQQGKGGPSPSFSHSELRSLVLDYLCHNSFTSTARAFVRDSAIKHLDADGDELMTSTNTDATDTLTINLEHKLKESLLRKEIREHILSGHVAEATSLLREHFPSVLAEPDTMSDDDEHSDSDSTGKLCYVPRTSVEPAHLALNLRIHAFIEGARTVPLLYYPPGRAFSNKQPSPTPARTKVNSPMGEDTNTPSPQQQELIHRAQSLYSEAHCLTKPNDRAQYIAELTQVTGLLAYTNPENSPVAPYLSQLRRESVAEQIESAVFYRSGQLPISLVELICRTTSMTWSLLRELDGKLPLRSKWPEGIQLPQIAAPPRPVIEETVSNHPLTGKKTTVEKESGEPVPLFDLAEFLDLKS